VRLKVVGSAPFYVDPSCQSVYPTGQHFGTLTETGATDCYYTFQQPNQSFESLLATYRLYLYTHFYVSFGTQCRP